MTLTADLQRILDRDKLGKMWVDVSLPSNSLVKVRLIPNETAGPDSFVLDVRWNDDKGRLAMYCDLGTVEAIHKATEPRE